MKKVVAIILVVLMTGLIVACEHIEDTNGEDTSLATITMEKLSGTSISQTTSGVSSQSERNNITTVNQYEDIDLDLLIMEGGMTSGISNIVATELKAGERFFVECESEVDEGNLQIILLSPDNDVLYEFKTGEYDSCEITADVDGVYLVRMGSESFGGFIGVARTLE